MRHVEHPGVRHRAATEIEHLLTMSLTSTLQWHWRRYHVGQSPKDGTER